MNKTGCPDGYARDNFISILDRPSCDVPVIAYWILVSFSILLRLFFSFISIKIAFKLNELKKMKRKERDELKKQGDNKNQTNSVYFKPISDIIENSQIITWLEFCLTIVIIIMYLLFGFDIIDASSGTGPLLYGLGGMFYGAAIILSYLKTIKFSMRINPNSIKSNEKNERDFSEQ